MSDGTRTRGRRDHNPELYQLSYAHHASGSLAAIPYRREGLMLALTFDDGPDPRGTPAVLDALRAAGAKATFFVLGEQVVRHPALLARVIVEGHDVQVHGHAHLRHPETPQAEIEADLAQALATLGRAGVRPSRWRIPFGQPAEFTPEIAHRNGLELVGWTVDTIDWRGDSTEAMLAPVRLELGAIVLAHDGVGDGVRRSDASATARLIGPLVAAAREAGLRPGPLTSAWPVPVPLGDPG